MSGSSSNSNLSTLPSRADCLPDRREAIVPGRHVVFDREMADQRGNIIVPEDHELILFGMGCFWGAERIFWQCEGVFLTAVGYAGGHTRHASYEDVCSGLTAHTEVVAVVYSAERVSLASLLALFWQGHNPTQGMRQGNDQGSQYRSAIYCTSDSQITLCEQTRESVDSTLLKNQLPMTTTEILRDQTFSFAEEYHQQYLHKNPGGYCGLGGMGVDFELSS